MNKKIAISILCGLLFLLAYTPSDLNKFGTKSIIDPMSANDTNINLDGNEQVDLFFAGNGTDGLTYETAYCYNYSEIAEYVSIQNSTRFIIFDTILVNNTSPIGGIFYVSNCSNIYIQNSTIIIGDSYEAILECIGMDNNENVNLINNTIYGGFITYIDMTYCNISNNNIASHSMIQIFNCNHFNIDYNFLDDSVSQKSSIYFMEVTNSSYISIKNNYTPYRNYRLYSILGNIYYNAFTFYGINDYIYIENNTFYNSFSALNSHDTISNLIFQNNQFYGLLLGFTMNITSNFLINNNIFEMFPKEAINPQNIEESFLFSSVLMINYAKLDSSVHIENNAIVNSPMMFMSSSNSIFEGIYEGQHTCQFHRNYYDNYLFASHSSYIIDLNYFEDRFLIDNLTYLRDNDPRWHFERFGESYSLNDKPILTDYDQYIYGDQYDQNIITWNIEDVLKIDPYYQIYLDGELIIEESLLTADITFDILSLGELNQENYNLTIIYFDGIGGYSEYSINLIIFAQNNALSWALGILIPIIALLSIPTALYFIGRKKIAPKKVSAKVGKITCNSLGGLYRNGLCTLKKKV